MGAARGLSPVDGENHIAVLQLQSSVRRRAHHEYTLLRPEVLSELGSQRGKLHVGHGPLDHEEMVHRRQRRQDLGDPGAIESQDTRPREHRHSEILRLAIAQYTHVHHAVRYHDTENFDDLARSFLAIHILPIYLNDHIARPNPCIRCWSSGTLPHYARAFF